VAGGLSDSTVQFPAVGGRADVAGGLSDSTVQFPAVGLMGDATMPFPIVSPRHPDPAEVNNDSAEAELRSLIQSILAGLKPREREVIELSFRQAMNDDDLAIVLDVSWSRARALAARARGRLEEALFALHILLTRRDACPALGELLADWDGQLTDETWELISWHVKDCQTCTHHGWGAMRPAAFFRLLPPAPLPPELREQVLSRCTSPAEDAAAYRRRVARRAKAIWFAWLSQVIRRLSWASIRAHPGPAIAAAAVAVWVVAAVSVTLLAFPGSHAANVRAPQPSTAHIKGVQASVGTSPRSPAGAPGTVAAPESGPAKSSPAAALPSASAAFQGQSPYSPQAQPSPSTKSPSPKPSKSASPSPSHSASPSRTASPSASPSHTSSPSSSPSPAA
jgi:Sigma-70, region 4